MLTTTIYEVSINEGSLRYFTLEDAGRRESIWVRLGYVVSMRELPMEWGY